jgi:dienelactone hydrolase
VGLWPLPDRVPLDVHESAPLDHPWCTVRRIYYRLWPGVYSSGLLFMPKQLGERPAPAVLCPHGHWANGNAHPEVQKRCLSFARLGYVTFSSTQNHYEDLYVGVSHQTLMVWNNIRALDYLESLGQVDKSRIGVAGASGGGLQTEMLVALDDRVRAATIVGLTCDFREIMFPHRHHCTCNHFPQVMQFTDHPEISALGLPTPLQFLTMNDWTKSFQRDNLPTVRELYAANGFPDRMDCQYYDTPHSYDREKRERTYGWMERWLRGRELVGPADGGMVEPVAEPDDVETIPVETIENLSAEVPENKGFGELTRIYTEQRGYRAPTLSTPGEWKDYRQRTLAALRDLLGLDVELPRAHAEPRTLGSLEHEGLVIERVGYPSEGGILVPTTVLHRKDAEGKLPVVIVFSAAGRDALLEATGPGSPRQLALDGSLVALPDVRCYGEMLFAGDAKDEKLQRRAWERNGIVWGRPVPGMACTDIRGVLDGLAARPDADVTCVKLATRDSGGLAVAVLFAAAVDPRVASVDVDLGGACFAKRSLPLVSCVLQHGDVLQWAALCADRTLTLRNVPPEAGDPAWLRAAFAAAENPAGLHIEP